MSAWQLGSLRAAALQAVFAGLPEHGASALSALRRTALMASLVLGVLALPSLLGLWLDERQILGASVWAKPLKFQLSFALHWLTVAWLLGLVSPQAAASRGLRTWVMAGAVAALVEVAYITLQGARGRASHFSEETSIETVLYYALMGGAALVMMASTIAVGVWLWRHPSSRNNNPALRLGGALGLVIGSVVTVLVTAPLAAGAIDGPGPWVGGLRSYATGLPITGWSTTGGDLRVPHFFAAHLIQALPVVGWIADRALAPRDRQPVVWFALGLGILIVSLTFMQAVQGEPFIAR